MSLKGESLGMFLIYIFDALMIFLMKGRGQREHGSEEFYYNFF